MTRILKGNRPQRTLLVKLSLLKTETRLSFSMMLMGPTKSVFKALMHQREGSPLEIDRVRVLARWLMESRSRLNGLSVIGIGGSSGKYYLRVTMFVYNKSKRAWLGTTSIIKTSKALLIVSYMRLQKMKRARQGWDYGVTRIPFRRGNFGMGIDFSLKNVIREMHCRFLTN